MLWVAITAATPVARTSWVSSWNTCVRGARIEVAGRLVGEQERGALATARAIATRCCSPPESSAGRWVQPLAEAEIAEQLGGARRRLALARRPADHLRQHHVLQRGELGQQLVELVDEADVGAADARCARRRQPRGGAAVDVDLARVRRSSRPAMCSSVDLPAPDGPTSATDWPGQTLELGALAGLERRVALA